MHCPWFGIAPYTSDLRCVGQERRRIDGNELEVHIKSNFIMDCFVWVCDYHPKNSNGNVDCGLLCYKIQIDYCVETIKLCTFPFCSSSPMLFFASEFIRIVGSGRWSNNPNNITIPRLVTLSCSCFKYLEILANVHSFDVAPFVG